MRPRPGIIRGSVMREVRRQMRNSKIFKSVKFSIKCNFNYIAKISIAFDEAIMFPEMKHKVLKSELGNVRFQGQPPNT